VRTVIPAELASIRKKGPTPNVWMPGRLPRACKRYYWVDAGAVALRLFRHVGDHLPFIGVPSWELEGKVRVEHRLASKLVDDCLEVA
jgi:hypothetical protein